MIRVYLIGFMASGKSYLSRVLSAEMDVPLIDMDKYIEEKNFMSVPELFSTYGENVFRERERKALEDLSVMEDVIIATGGGAPCFFNNIQVMNDTGVTLYIKVPEEVIVERLLNSKHKRPLADGKSREELTEFVSQKIAEREPFYSQAKAVINPLEQPLDEIISLIKKLA
ncbi:shikimate kinase [Saccharicrinis sp. FJH54]|uniref:shikimate kinase n=1 Tax=Saccharicrinis sp. FJH54 TaxID=3344665 RepID=UPI0035D4BDDB